jgi:anti-sigma B factor antagonist
VELTIDTREADGVTLLDVSGILTRGTPSEALLGRVEKLLAAGKKKLILNLSEVTFFDSMGLGALMKAVILAEEQGASLKLVQPRDMTSSPGPLEMYGDETEALASFQPAPLQ